MSYVLLDSADTVHVYGPNLAVPAIVATIQSGGSGSILLQTLDKAVFNSGRGRDVLNGLATGVDGLIAEGYAIAASGIQDIDTNNLLYDAVRFVVAYTPPVATGGTITTDVDVRVEYVNFSQAAPGESAGNIARDQLQRAYDLLQGMASA
jgi:hypothetical protein